jgi:hypothetical protein
MNPANGGYLRGLEKELGENSNALRVELNRFEKAGILKAEWQGHRKLFILNRNFPLFPEFQSIAMKHFGIDQLIETVLQRIGPLEAVYLTGALASGLDTGILDLRIIGSEVNTAELDRLVAKAEKLISRKIRYVLFESNTDDMVPKPCLRIL